jgi:hypothetical protein
VAEATLVTHDIQAGAALLTALDEAHVPVPLAFWYLDPEPQEWRLYLGTPLVDKDGPRAVYTQIQNVLRGQGVPPIELDRISVVSSSSQLPELVRNALSTGPGFVYRWSSVLRPAGIEVFPNPARLTLETHTPQITITKKEPKDP